MLLGGIRELSSLLVRCLETGRQGVRVSDGCCRSQSRDVHRYEYEIHVPVLHEEGEGLLLQLSEREALSFDLSEGLAPELARVLLT